VESIGKVTGPVLFGELMVSPYSDTVIIVQIPGKMQT